VPKRHQVLRNSMLDATRDGQADMEGLVLLDLPDHDSTEVAHHVEVDRLVALADMLVWVLDPQKYADAVLHDRYLHPMADHAEIVLVVLNHIDTVHTDRRESMLDDLRRLLREDGLGDVPVLAISAKHGEGVPALSKQIAARVAAKKAASTRLRADVHASATAMADVNGSAKPGNIARARSSELVDAFADAAGVPTVVAAVRKATRKRAAQATGWPVTAWLGRLRPDPLGRLHLDLGSRDRQLTSGSRASMPEATPVQRARVDSAVREVADDVAAELSPPWAAAVHRASVSRLPDLGDALDRAVSSTDLGVSRSPLWWRGVRALQWLLVLAAVVGGLWLASLAVIGYLRGPAPDVPAYAGFPLPTILLVGGVLVGIVVGVLCRALVAVSSRAKARAVDRRLRSAIAEVTETLVVEPIEAEVEAYRTVRSCLATALRP
ncbi:MAG: ABC transporter, partial [Marmoricola sp.]